MSEIVIGEKTVGGDHPTYFVADIAANHDGEWDRFPAMRAKRYRSQHGMPDPVAARRWQRHQVLSLG